MQRRCWEEKVMGEPSPFSLAGQRILVAGAAGGIGSATSRVCASLGATIIAVDLKTPLAIAKELESKTDISAHTCDFSRRDDVEKLARATGPVDGLVDLAAICPFGDWMAPDWNDELMRVLAVNVGGPLNLMRAYFPSMVERGGGRVVLTGSLAGRTGGLRSGAHYAASKGGIHALVRWFAQRGQGHNVLVNGVAPGTTQTQMIEGNGYVPSAYPQNRFAKPEEIAGAIAFLLSPASSFVSGVVLDVNGGIQFS
jgi:NAD(P)-dependent dehydrogenase (short-subunit alcohol dehydrogenase family)